MSQIHFEGILVEGCAYDIKNLIRSQAHLISTEDDDCSLDCGMGIGARIKQAREARGIKQRALAQLCGIPQSTLSTIEAEGITTPKSTVVLRISRLLGVSYEWLTTAEGRMEKGPGGALVADLLSSFHSLDPKQQEALVSIAKTLAK